MISKAFKLDGKTAIVAGDSKYWSKYVSKILLEAGANVIVASKNTRSLDEIKDVSPGYKQSFIVIPTDTTDRLQIESMTEQVINKFGRIDILVNTSNLLLAKPFLKISEDELYQVFDTNLVSVFHCCQIVGKEMIKQKKGRIINMVSCMAERGVENFSVYCMSMGGVLQLTRALNLEWAGSGITVNAIGTGWMSETEKTGDINEESLLKYIPLKRYGKPDEVGPLVVYLASDTSDFLSGQFLYVDGAVMSHL